MNGFWMFFFSVSIKNLKSLKGQRKDKKVDFLISICV
ncbi:hypothetical protein cje28_08112 [Campylobacter jejuni subsp. jejuni 51037]|nr:hypothetical protein cje28_08112 [Campylobacter jejuni subsp. jejuni 51037]